MHPEGIGKGTQYVGKADDGGRLSGRTAKFGGEDAGNQRCRRCQTEQENLFFQFAETEGRCKQKTDERENEGLMRQKKKRRPWPVVVSLFLFPVSQMHADGEQSERKKKAPPEFAESPA